MDKILFSTFFALMAGFIAAAMSFVKLVNDKESRITDYREEWTNSVRKAIADFVAHVNSNGALHAKMIRTTTLMDKLSNSLTDNDGSPAHREITQQQLDHQQINLENYKKEILVLSKEMNQTYTFARLHFKQNDPAFSTIEGKYDNIRILLNELASSSYDEKQEPSEITGKLDLYCNDIVTAARGIMKDEWERIKKGELTYQKTKSGAKWGGVLLLFILLTVGVHAAISANRERTAEVIQTPPIVKCENNKNMECTDSEVQKNKTEAVKNKAGK